MPEQPSLADDPIEGAEAIGAEYGKSPRWAFQMLEKKAIPGFKFAGRWHSRKSSIRAHIERLEREAAA